MRFFNTTTFSAVSILFIFYLIAIAPGCSKSTVTAPDNIQNTEGTFYIQVLQQSGGFRLDKVDAGTGFTGWEIPMMNTFASFGSPVDYSDGLLFHGNYSGVSAYNIQSSEPQWGVGWLATTEASSARILAFKDSLVFFASSSNSYSSADAYCVNKYNGAIIWQQRIDSGGWTFYNFSSIPVVSDDKPIMLTRDKNGHKQLRAFRATDGKLVWQSPINDLLLPTIKTDNGKIYATGGGFMFCYNATDGSLLWKTDIQYKNAFGVYFFYDATKLVVAADGWPVMVLDKTNGTILSSFDLPLPVTNPNSFLYKDNVLYASGLPIDTVFQVRAFDITAKTQKWIFRYTTNCYSQASPIITDKYLVVPVSTAEPSDVNNNQLKMIFVDFSGKLVKQFPFLGYSADHFIYVNSNNVYREQMY